MLESLPFPSPQVNLQQDASDASTDILIVGISAKQAQSPSLARLNEMGGGWIDRLVQRGAISCKRGKVNKLVPATPDAPPIVLLIGLGDDAHANRVDAFEIAAIAMRAINNRAHARVDIALGESFDPATHDAMVAGALNACENLAIYHSAPSVHVPESLYFSGIGQDAIDRGQILGQAMMQTRRLVNEPAGVMYPESFAEQASEIASETGLSIEVWDEQKLASEGCRAILAVGAGSARPPRLVILRHQGGGDEAPIALVGKGVTFDSGGLSIKPSDGMVDMKCDMAGAATVLGVMQAIARLGLKRNVIGICGLAENMISGTSYKLGDVIKTRNGKTVEILNTDAEGRVVLADSLDVAVQHQPSHIVDLATLTGACMVALGNEVAGFMTNNQPLCDAVTKSAQTEGEPVWQLPMFELYNDKVKSKVADIKNVGEGRWGGAITAAKFLENFVGETPWLHIDIAGPAFGDAPKPHRDAGASGVMVRTLLNWIESPHS
ncbi:Cytosol aminopeptidase [Novipirellula galeiformis]|uniref:Probable cytosol aminopeptidase n=1 Tax=Novipirellula galeiformis TaxID=2528004 RepID=A0A5C6CFS3_9BACT|nr:leucyl aminopeptidase [Novipirellula galeiformis]TWU23148.1 Cytosol aminopeptidase [Novipirellula galeiformis]